MSFLVSCFMLLTAILFIYSSYQIRDEVLAQINKMLGVLIFLLSFLFSPFSIKLIMLLGLLILWEYPIVYLSQSFDRQRNK